MITSLETLRADNNRLVLELSRNKSEVRSVENDAEKSTMGYLIYKAKRKVKEAEKGVLSGKDRHEIAGEVAREGYQDLKPCLQSELILTYWGSLESVDPDGQRFSNTKYFSSKWSQETIHQPGGGVS